MSDEPKGSREQGIEFGSLADALEDESYPISHEKLLERYGDHELGFGSRTAPLREVLVQKNEREYEDPESVRQSVFNMVGEDAIGREGYTDRGGQAPTTNDSADPESF